MHMDNTTLRRRTDRLILSAAALIAANILLILSARIQVPFWPVPMTMQTLVVVGLGLALGRRLGVAAVALYLIEGAVGLPVLAGTPERGIGLAYMAGPTGGYLAGFLLAVAVVGALADAGRARGLAGTALAVLAGHAIIHVAGALWLAGLAGWAVAWGAGTLPFLPGTLAKAALTVLAAPPLANARRHLTGGR